MRVRDALKASAAIPFYFSPVKSPFAENDLLVDGCLTDCEWTVSFLGRVGGGFGGGGMKSKEIGVLELLSPALTANYLPW
jgi:hypothetical protein